MPTLMIIGAAAGQLPIIRKAKSLGIRTLVVSQAGSLPGFREADEGVPIDIFQLNEIEALARARAVDGVLTSQSELCLPTVAAMARRLNLPGVPEAIVSMFGRKHELREHCVARGISTPRFTAVRTASELAEALRYVGYPAVLKPDSNDGSRGVVRIDGKEENPTGWRAGLALEKVLALSGNGIALVEEFVSGQEVVVESIVRDGNVTNLVAGDSSNIGLPSAFVPAWRFFPSTLPPGEIKAVFSAMRKLYSGLGNFFAPAHAEFIIRPFDRTPCLIDAHIRGGGAYIQSHIVPLVCGVDLDELCIRAALRDPSNADASRPIENKQHAGYVAFVLPQGRILDDLQIEIIDGVPGVRFHDLPQLAAGSETRAPMDKTSRLGPIVISADSREGLLAVRESLRRRIALRVQTAGGIQFPLWE